ncbi:Hypothetical predicted protein [Cloeon dipterum]|uniref:Uncharacterized protein n=1 Tax=Cloeon dipterum TaxID=197152 RepID=A0A8S1DDI4_9INSE|nr:Hypothetical predicted protein [Cloeon dipterum]
MTKSHSLTYSCCIHDQKVPSKGLDYSNDEISTREHEPEELDGFKIEAKGSKLELSKMFGNDESVKIYFNVNHTVKLCEHNRRDYDDEMRYKPTTFKIELIKGDRILDLKCSFNHPTDDCNGHPFKIDDIGLYVGEQKIKIEIHADSRNNLTREGSEQQAKLLKMLNDKGLDFEFARKLYHLVIKYERKPDM